MLVCRDASIALFQHVCQPSPTCVAMAGMSGELGRSVRRKTMPVSGEAGSSVMAMLDPLCRPTPVAPMRVFRVRCANMSGRELR